ncbi:MAG TPA: fumarate reductase subunit C, partial [Myxococcota bacterium]|nr:fumarate reductase subunit C [Myxococcota bacterium]
EAAFEGWREALRSPWSIAAHLVLLVSFLYHTWSWFEIMPKTMPPVVVGGRRLAAATITALGLAASAAASAALLALALWAAA